MTGSDIHVCVLGGGTAGFIAAASLSRHFPTVQLTHVFSSKIPPIGVGEGTTPPFLHWIHEITGLDAAALRERCGVTRKDGIQFEGWGEQQSSYTHYFAGREGHAYHISADRICELLGSYVNAHYRDAVVKEVDNEAQQATVVLADDTRLSFDLVIDARGFPRELNDRDHQALPIIPTNSALVRRSSAVLELTATRAVARPHGWIFVIPLAAYTSFGYIHNRQLSSHEDVSADFEAFLHDEEIEDPGQARSLDFPNFVRRECFSGRLFAIGNAASFLEPLEATAITTTLYQLNHIKFWLSSLMLGHGSLDSLPALISDDIAHFVQRIGYFVSWHYAMGARQPGPFWQHAQRCFHDCSGDPELVRARQDFDEFAARASTMPRELAFASQPQALAPYELPDGDETLGGFLLDSFAKVGHGIGYFEQDMEKGRRHAYSHTGILQGPG
jgi:tryptophan halogenase